MVLNFLIHYATVYNNLVLQHESVVMDTMIARIGVCGVVRECTEKNLKPFS